MFCSSSCLPGICWPPTKHSVWRGQLEATAFRCACTLDEPKNTCPTCVDFQCYQEWTFQKKGKNSKVGRWKVNFQETNIAQELEQKTHLGNLQTGRAGSYFHSSEKRLWKKTSLPWCPLPKPSNPAILDASHAVENPGNSWCGLANRLAGFQPSAYEAICIKCCCFLIHLRPKPSPERNQKSRYRLGKILFSFAIFAVFSSYPSCHNAVLVAWSSMMQRNQWCCTRFRKVASDESFNVL